MGTEFWRRGPREAGGGRFGKAAEKGPLRGRGCRETVARVPGRTAKKIPQNKARPGWGTGPLTRRDVTHHFSVMTGKGYLSAS